MENMKTMTVQMPEETYRCMKDYLKRHDMKQKDFLDLMLQRALDKEADTVALDTPKE